MFRKGAKKVPWILRLFLGGFSKCRPNFGAGRRNSPPIAALLYIVNQQQKRMCEYIRCKRRYRAVGGTFSGTVCGAVSGTADGTLMVAFKRTIDRSKRLYM